MNRPWPHRGDQPEQALAALVRDEGRRVLATLVRTTGDWALAEDAVQDAVLRALRTWPRTGVPEQPRGWLTLTARRRAIDLMRREAARTGKEAAAMDRSPHDEHGFGDPLVDDPPEVVRDDQLRLVFTCCHPALAPATRVALALRVLCGLSTAEVARALLVTEATMTRRLSRARQKIAQAGIPYRVPAGHELPERLGAVAAVVYLLFNEGYSATDGADSIRPALVDEAVRLARLLRELMPDEPTSIGLLALVLLQDSRRDARQDARGRTALLADQDRPRWRRELIDEGVLLVGEGLRRCPDRPDRYLVQAAIAGCHALAPTWPNTDWSAVVSWYDVLLTLDDTPVVRLNRAVALAERDGAHAGLAAIDRVDGLSDYPLAHAARAELLVRAGRTGDARAAYAAALALPQNAGQREHVRARLAALAGPPADTTVPAAASRNPIAARPRPDGNGQGRGLDSPG